MLFLSHFDNKNATQTRCGLNTKKSYFGAELIYVQVRLKKRQTLRNGLGTADEVADDGSEGGGHRLG